MHAYLGKLYFRQSRQIRLNQTGTRTITEAECEIDVEILLNGTLQKVFL